MASQIRYMQKSYGGSPFIFFANKDAADAAHRAGRIPEGMIVCTLDDTIGQLVAAQVRYNNDIGLLESDSVQDSIDELATKTLQHFATESALEDAIEAGTVPDGSLVVVEA